MYEEERGRETDFFSFLSEIDRKASRIVNSLARRHFHASNKCPHSASSCRMPKIGSRKRSDIKCLLENLMIISKLVREQRVARLIAM